MTDKLSNDAVELVPRTVFDGSGLELDFPGLQIGVAEYDEGPTGCTVFLIPKGAALAIDVRGGAVGLIGGDYLWTHGICLAGGSLYGLEAAAGVTAELFARRGYSVGWTDFALVSGAIIYDYGPRQNAIYPDKALGRAAVRAAREGWFPLGGRGAGRSATVGKGFSDRYQGEPAGQGGAFGQVGPVKVAVFTVVNALGAIVDRSGAVVRGCLDPATGQRAHPTSLAAAQIRERQTATTDAQPDEGVSTNTTLTVLVTNLRLNNLQLRQLGRQVHTSMARGIQPFQTITDGDVLFAVSTNEVESPDAAGGIWLGSHASELAWDAILASY